MACINKSQWKLFDLLYKLLQSEIVNMQGGNSKAINRKFMCKANNMWRNILESKFILIIEERQLLKRPTLARHCVISIIV